MGSLFQGAIPSDFDLLAQALGVVFFTGTQAAINHLGIGVTARLTDFSGYWILLITAVLTGCLLAFAPGLDPSRLIRFENFSGSAGGNVWPATLGMGLLFAQGLLLPAYTITGFDASAHAAEETKGAIENVPRGILRSVLVSGAAGWVLLAVVVLAAPSVPHAAAQGEGAFNAILTGVLPWPLWASLVAAIVLAQYLCGLATLTSASRIAYAFARDGGLPGLIGCGCRLPEASLAALRDLERRTRLLRLFNPLHAGVCYHHGGIDDFPLHLLCRAVCSWRGAATAERAGPPWAHGI